MLLGVDFGTTRTIVAHADRGNYPVVSFTDELGDAHGYFPSVVARVEGGLVFGFEALAAAREGAPTVRSFKRALASPAVGAATTLRIGDGEVPLLEVVSGFLAALRHGLATDSSIAGQLAGESDNTVVSIPAHAHSAQRFLTLEAFRRAGFSVAAMVNEPSAAGFEYTHRQPRSITARRNRIVVYDLGGGTFDSSLVQIDGGHHEVLGSLGVSRLGGDDFDAVLARLALTASGVDADSLGAVVTQALLDECREVKERIAPQSKRVVVDVAGDPVTVSVEAFYEAASELVEQTLGAMAPLLGEDDAELAETAGIYLVGGGSGLPLVPRMLRARFGRRVHRSPHPASSTAIGLAIAADTEAGFSLTERLSRGFGVFRESRDGHGVVFDQIFSRDEVVDAAHPLVVTRRYRAVHNVGWYRFVEYGSVDADGQPRGDLVPFADTKVPFDPRLQDGRFLDDVEIHRVGHAGHVEETYTIDANGIVEVRIVDLDTGYTQQHTLHT